MKKTFPKQFLWGTSTAACQIESTKGTSWYGLETRDQTSVDKNIEHDRYRTEDAKIITGLGNAYRFNPDWAKLQRAPFGKLNPSAVKDYRNFLEILKSKGMHVMLTLHHFANPDWFETAGSWQSSQAPMIFSDYATKMAQAFGDQVDSWITINEPTSSAFLGYFLGYFPPHKKSILATLEVLNRQKAAHRLAYDALKEQDAKKPVGVSNSTMDFQAASLLGHASAGIFRKIHMEWVPDLFLPADFMGINYYGRIPFTPLPISEVQKPGILSKLGREHDKMWEYYPQGLEEVIIKMYQRYQLPIMITENGCCTDNDRQRILSIQDHLSAVHKAIAQDIPVLGYFHWSTFDNVEHHLGSSFRFGLVHVDYSTMERTIKPSGKFYASVAKENMIHLH